MLLRPQALGGRIDAEFTMGLDGITVPNATVRNSSA
jgi:hypothetical protein